MLEPITKIEFDKFSEAIPAFICLIAMPLTYSISNGILLGIISYAVINILCGKFKKLTPTLSILAVLFVLKFVFVNPTESAVENNIPMTLIQNVYQKFNNASGYECDTEVNIAMDKKEQILAALNIKGVENVDAEYQKSIVADYIITKDSVAQTGGYDVTPAQVSQENLPVFVANIDVVNEEDTTTVTKYVIPITGLMNGYAAIDEDGTTIYGLYLSHKNAAPADTTSVAANSSIIQ